ncbi:MAG: transcriptional repressor [Spirochaetales bacterium]|nr:transcriptional repressor [Spirochaetales bacterium]
MRNRWGQQLENRGFRITRAREMVLQILESTPDHLSAEDIYMQIYRSCPGTGLTTIYRTLELLENNGIVDKIDFGHNSARFELAEGYSKKKHHHHLVCRNCGRIIDYTEFLDAEMDYIKKTESELAARHGFKIDRHIIQFSGICAECAGRGAR